MSVSPPITSKYPFPPCMLTLRVNVNEFSQIAKPPPGRLIEVALPKSALEFTASKPPLTVRLPENVFVPVRNNVPAPALMK